MDGGEGTGNKDQGHAPPVPSKGSRKLPQYVPGVSQWPEGCPVPAVRELGK